MKEIKRILVANRAEIAVRVMKTCEKMGIETIAIYAEDDAELSYVRRANYSVCLGSGPLSETYLNQDKIVEIALELGADAIHPGYGFLSENAGFAELVTGKDLIFIGPTPEAIVLMGDKKTSKQAMEKIGAPIIPGYHGEQQEPSFLKSKASEIGFPLLIKASAGGGGKGMRVVHTLDEFDAALEAAKREAKNAFGNDVVLLERFIQNPRHIEVQVVGDTHGNCLHFYERECSIQRRHQKVIEETPSVALSSEKRIEICESAVKIAKGIDYVGAGTVEFIYEDSGDFFFLEMNTRLQVEHPITEMVTGVDLVRLQIRAARGEKLPYKQDQISQKGHSIEVRLYAEDPTNNFLPTSGRLELLRQVDWDGVRIETGFESGNIIGVNYDPMIAKVVVWDEDRDLASDKMIRVLDEAGFLGLTTNKDYCKKVLSEPDYRKGETLTHYIENHSELQVEDDLDESQVADFVASFYLSGRSAASGKIVETSQLQGPWTSLSMFRNS